MIPLHLGTMMQRLPLQKSVTILIMIVGSTLVFATISLVTIIGQQNMKRELQSELKMTSELIGSRNAGSIEFNNKEVALRNMGILGSNKTLKLACLYDAAGNVFVEFKTSTQEAESVGNCPKLEKGWDGQFEEMTAWKSSQLLASNNILHNGNLVGAIFLLSEPTKVEEYFYTQLIIGLISILMMIPISYLLAKRFQEVITKPIVEIAKLAQLSMSNQGQGLITSETLYNELGSIVDAFNHILRERRYIEIERNNQLLRVFDGCLAFHSIADTISSRCKEQVMVYNMVGSMMQQRLLGDYVYNYLDYFGDLGSVINTYRSNTEEVNRLSRMYENTLRQNKELTDISDELKKLAHSKRICLHWQGKINILSPTNLVVEAYADMLIETLALCLELICRVVGSADGRCSVDVEIKHSKFLQLIFSSNANLDKYTSSNQSLNELIHLIKSQGPDYMHDEEDRPMFFNESFQKTDFDFFLGCIRYVAVANQITVKSVIESAECQIILDFNNLVTGDHFDILQDHVCLSRTTL